MFLNVNKPHLRNFTYSLLEAAKRFKKASLSDHAIRCYSLIYQMYRKKNWGYIENHLQIKLSRQYALSGKYLQSLYYSEKLLKNCLITCQFKQNTHLREYLYSAQVKKYFRFLFFNFFLYFFFLIFYIFLFFFTFYFLKFSYFFFIFIFFFFIFFFIFFYIFLFIFFFKIFLFFFYFYFFFYFRKAMKSEK